MPDVSNERQVTTVARSPRVNLLPPEIAEAARFRRFQMAMGGAVVGAVVIVGALYVHGQSAVKDAQSQLDSANARQASLQTTLTSLQGVQNVYSQVAAKRAMLTQAMGSEIRWSGYLADLSLRVPDNVWLTTIQATETSTGLTGTPAPVATTPSLTPAGVGTINFGGIAFSHDDVATWLDVLAKERGFADPYFSNSTESLIGSKPVVNYTSSVVLTNAAESGHYTQPAGS